MPYFPNSPFCQKLSPTAPLHKDSVPIIKLLVEKSARACLNTDRYSFPVWKATSATKRIPVRLVKKVVSSTGVISYKPKTDQLKFLNFIAQGIPLKPEFKPAAGKFEGTREPDAHLIVIETDTKKAWGLWRYKWMDGNPQCEGGGFVKNYETGTGQVENLSGGWGERATGLSGLFGLILRSELEKGVIPHAGAIALLACKKGIHVPPAMQHDGYSLAQYAPIQGMRLRLPASHVSKATIPILRMKEEQMRDYGDYIVDSAGNPAWFAEDPMTAGGGYSKWTQGLANWQIWPKFPWAKLQVVA